MADQISDALLDAFLEQDKSSRVAIETLLTRGVAVVAGEVTTHGYVDVAKVVRSTINAAGYTDTDLGFDGNTCGVLVAIQGQSGDIAMGVDVGGAGDQGMMFGYATRETPELMPLPISIAHALTRQASEVRRRHPALGLRPDVKSQVSVEYDEQGKPKPRSGGIRITLARFYSPNGQALSGAGVNPHVLEENKSRQMEIALEHAARYVSGMTPR